MSERTEAAKVRLGCITLAVLLVVMAASFNLQNFPGFKGSTYHAEFADASGLRVGSQVQLAGIRVGRVTNLRIGPSKVIVDFDVKNAEFGDRTGAAVEVQNLLGEKFLHLSPAGAGEMSPGSTIPLARTDISADIVGTLGQLTEQTEATDRDQLATALDTVGGTLNDAAPEIKESFRGVSRLSKSIASRDAEIEDLLQRAQRVTTLLNQRKGDMVKLMEQASLLFDEIKTRKAAIRRLLVNTEKLAVELRGLVRDNQAQLNPALKQIDESLTFLRQREKRLQTLLHNYGPYVNILGNIIGTGPWFDAYVPNIAGVFTGEFVTTKPGKG